MGKLQVCLLAAIVLGAMSRCEEVAGPYPDSFTVAVPRPSSATSFSLSSCAKLTMNVRFKEIKLKGPDSDVVYHRTTVTDLHLQFATNETVNISSTDFLTCARAAASQDLDAFLFNDTCTGYRLGQHFLKCQTGDLVLYVRSDSLNDEAVMMPFEEASSKLIDVGLSQPYELRMLHAFLYPESWDFIVIISAPLGEAIKLGISSHSVIVLENEEVLLALNQILDLSSCMTDGAYGLPIFVATTFDIYDSTILYLSEQCGETIPLQKMGNDYSMLVFSHPGHGCTYYPSDAPDECAVTFEPDAYYFFSVAFLYADTEEDCTGFNVTITGTDKQGNNAEINACPRHAMSMRDYPEPFTITIRRTSPEVWLGFISLLENN